MIKLSAMTYAIVLKLLARGEYTMYELAEKSGLHYATVIDYTQALRKVGMIHITDWLPDSRGHYSLKVYKLGQGRDVPRPAPIQARERTRAYRAKMKQQAMINAMAGALKVEHAIT